MRVKLSLLFRDVAPTIEEDMASRELLDLAPMIAANAKIAREIYSEKLREKGGADEQYDDYVGDDGYDDDDDFGYDL